MILIMLIMFKRNMLNKSHESLMAKKTNTTACTSSTNMHDMPMQDTV